MRKKIFWDIFIDMKKTKTERQVDRLLWAAMLMSRRCRLLGEPKACRLKRGVSGSTTPGVLSVEAWMRRAVKSADQAEKSSVTLLRLDPRTSQSPESFSHWKVSTSDLPKSNVYPSGKSADSATLLLINTGHVKRDRPRVTSRPAFIVTPGEIPAHLTATCG
ncbi:uncharacterized protein V6R79_001820 [Siganus canaliculatus]